MKNLKSVGLIGAALVATALFIGANGTARPPSVASENWIPVGDNAGFVLTTRQGDTLGAELYLKTEGRWIRGRLENPVSVTKVGR